MFWWDSATKAPHFLFFLCYAVDLCLSDGSHAQGANSQILNTRLRLYTWIMDGVAHMDGDGFHLKSWLKARSTLCSFSGCKILFQTTCPHWKRSQQHIQTYFDLHVAFSLQTTACWCSFVHYSKQAYINAIGYLLQATNFWSSDAEISTADNRNLTCGCVSMQWSSMQCCMRALAPCVACGWVCVCHLVWLRAEWHWDGSWRG